MANKQGSHLTRFVKLSAPTTGSDVLLQVAQLAVYSSDANVARGKSCSASSGTPCSVAFDGTLSARSHPSIYHSANPNSDWMQVDLGGDFKVDRVVYYNRADCCQARIVGTKVELLSANNLVIGRALITTSASSTTLNFVVAATVCENSFQGGSWLLVRRVQQGSTWHPATDDLRGTDLYGIYGTSTSAASFSIGFAALVNASTEFLFATGMCFKRDVKPTPCIFLSNIYYDDDFK